MTKYFSPSTMDELVKDLASMTENSRIISGGTDFVIQINQGRVKPDALLYLGNIPQTHEVIQGAESLEIGCMVTMTQLAENKLMVGAYQAISDACAHVGSKQIRNTATVGGNLGNVSPAGDLMPVWFLLGAEVLVVSADGSQNWVGVEDIFLAPGKSSLKVGDAILRFRLPLAVSHRQKTAFVKLGSRKELTISRIGLAAQVNFDEQDVMTAFQLVAGAISPTPIHVKAAEEYAIGKTLSPETVEQIGKYLSQLIMEVTPEHFDRDYKAAAAFGVVEDVLNQLGAR